MNKNEHMIPIILRNMGDSVLSPHTSSDQKLMYEAALIAARQYCDDVLNRVEASKNKSGLFNGGRTRKEYNGRS